VVVSGDANRHAALDRLPLPYSEALRLRDAGLPDELIAEIVGVEPEAFATMMRVAEAKLAAAEGRGDR